MRKRRPFKKVERKNFAAPETWQQLDTVKLCQQAGIYWKLEEKGWLPFVSGIRTFINPRITRALGYANYRRGTVELNGRYFKSHKFNRKKLEEKMLETFVHEIAHHLTHEYMEHKGHGKEWRSVMLWLGFKPERLGHI